MEQHILTDNRQNKRLTNIDLIETIAMLFVIMYHSTTYAYSFNFEEPTQVLAYLFRALLPMGVPLFFFANGYLIFNRPFNFKKHVKKTLRLMLLAIIWGALKIVILMPIKGEYLTFTGVWYGVRTWKLGWINSMWYIGALVCMYFFFPLLKQSFDNDRKPFYLFLGACLVFTFGRTLMNEALTVLNVVFLNKMEVVHRKTMFNMFNPFRGIFGYTFVYFCLGGCMYELKDKILKIKRWKRNTVAAVLMFLSSVGLFIYSMIHSKAAAGWDIVWNGYDTVFTLINVLCTFVLSLNYTKDIKLIRVISCNTLGIFFLHELFTKSLGSFIGQYKIFASVLGNAVYAFLVILACLAITLVCKKIPIVKKLF